MSDVIGRGVIEVVADATKLKAGISESKTALQTLKDAAKSAGESLTGQSTAYLRSLERQASAIERQAATFGKTKGEIAAYSAAQLGVSSTASALVARLQEAEKSLSTQKEAAKAAAAATAGLSNAQAGLAKNAKLTAFQQQQLGFQLHDFGVQVASGQSPLTAFIQQGSQLSGTFGGAGGAFRAVTSLLTPLRVALGSTAAAVGVLGFAFAEGQKQSKAFADAVALSGNFAGQTEGAFNSLARAVAAQTKSTVGDVREFAQALISTGEIGPQVFTAATTAAVGYARATGKTAAEVAKDFADMARSPTKFAAEANRSLNFLTAAQYAAIKAFEENGRAADAQGLIYDALNARFPKLQANMGTLEKALAIGKSAWSAFWDSAFDIGRTKTVEQKIEETAEKLRAAQGAAPTETGGGAALVAPRSGRRQSTVDRAAAKIAAEQAPNLRQLFRETENAFAESLRAQTQKEAIAADAVVDGYLKRGKAATLYKQKLDELNRSFTAKAQAGVPVSEADKKVALTQLKKDFTDPLLNQVREAQLALDIDRIKRDSEAVTNTLSNAERIMEATRAAGLVDERDYYAAKHAFLNLNEHEQESAFQKEIDRLRQEKVTGKDRLENDRKIQDAQAGLAKVRENAAASLQVLAVQEEAALKAIEQGFRNAEAAAQDYLDTLRRTQARDIAGFGLGNQERDRQAGRAQIEDRFSDQRRALERSRRDAELNGTFGPEAQRKYDDELDRIRRFQATALSEYDAYFQKRLQQEGNWANGASEALANYLAETRNVAKQTEELFSNAFHGMEDALVKFITTGKLDFKSLANSIVADITRIIVKQQIANAIMAIMGSGGQAGNNPSAFVAGGSGFLGSVGNFLGGLLGGRATGGPVSAGGLYRVNEKSPELLSVAGKQYLMMGDQGGKVAPQPKSDVRPVNVNIVQQFHRNTDRQTVDQAAAKAGAAVQRAVMRND